MPKEIEGEEYYSKEELEQKVEETKQELIGEKEELEVKLKNAVDPEKVEELEKQIADKDEELEGLKNKDHNFKNLRENKDEVSTKLEETNKRLDAILERDKKEVVGEYLEGKDLDKDQKEKFDHFFEKLIGDATDKREIANVAKNAYALAIQGDQVDTDPLKRNAPRAPGANQHKHVEAGEETKESKEMRKDFGISDDDHKKYGKADSIPLV